MPTFEVARSMILSSVSPLGVERVELLAALGRVVAEDVAAPWDLPLYDNSAMDGFAVRAADCRLGGSLRVTGYIPAGGSVTPAIEPGCAVRIMTGAPIPPGCDAVVPVEETERADDAVLLRERSSVSSISVSGGRTCGAATRSFPPAPIIRPPEISMLASFGKATVPVYRRARVAVLSTGDELIELGEQPGSGKIVNSNALSLAAAVREIGAEPVILGIARDNRESHREKMAEGLKADALVTSAGVSAGDRDLVRDCLAELEVRQLFWKVDIKPGGPVAFGMKEGKPVFSLPGNPVSTMITFEELVRPALLRMMGHRRVIKPYVQATLRAEVRKKAGKVHFLRVRIEVENGGNWAISCRRPEYRHPGNHAQGERYRGAPEGQDGVFPGEEVAVHLLHGDVGMLEE